MLHAQARFVCKYKHTYVAQSTIQMFVQKLNRSSLPPLSHHLFYSLRHLVATVTAAAMESGSFLVVHLLIALIHLWPPAMGRTRGRPTEPDTCKARTWRPDARLS